MRFKIQSATRFTEIVSTAIAAAGISAAGMPNTMPSLFSFTMAPQSASGGCTPRPINDRADRKSTAKMKRRPSSDTSGVSALGRISENTIQRVLSPRSRAASTKSITLMSAATARDSRNTRVASRVPITSTSTVMVDGSTDSTTSAKISVGMAISRSTPRDRHWSTQPPTTAATNPRMEPTVNDSAVARPAIVSVTRVPWIMRDSRSRPRLSVPSRYLPEAAAHTSPTTSPVG